MANDMLQTVLQAEAEAEQAIRQANQEAQAIRDRAQAEAEQAKADAAAKGERAVGDLLKRTRSQCVASEQSKLDQARQEADALCRLAQKNRAAVVKAAAELLIQ